MRLAGQAVVEEVGDPGPAPRDLADVVLDRGQRRSSVREVAADRSGLELTRGR